MERKGQAAMEFLMTYGWAILAAIIAIGVLAWFGVFNPGRLSQDTVFIGAPLGANAAKVNVSTVTIDLQNGAGENIQIRKVSVGSTCERNFNGATLGENPPTTVGNLGINISASSSALLYLNCTSTLDDTLRGTITVNYLKSTSTIEQSATGTLTFKVKAA